MSTYVLPDGKKLKIPTDPTEKLQLFTAVKNRYGIDLDDTSALTQAGEFFKAIPRGAVNLALSVPTGLAALADIGDDGSVLKGLRETKRYLDEDSILAGDPLYADMFSTKLGEGVGSFVPFLGAARVGQILAKGSKAIPKPFLGMDLASPSFQVPAALSVPVGMSEQADRIEMSRQLGEDVGGVAETLATLTGGVIGISELLPITSFLKKVPKAASRHPEIKEKIIQAIKYFGKGGLQEGTQEVLASLAQDVTAAGFYSDELPIGESMFDEFAIGGIIGGTANVVLKSMIGKKRSVTDSYLKDSEEKFRNLSDKDIEIRKKRYSDAQTQGTLDVVQEQLDTVIPDVPLPIDIGLSPNIEISQDADGKFSLIDMQENKKINTFENETQAIVAKDKIVNEYNNNLENNKIDNDLYNLGLINSSTGRVIGKTVQNKNVTEVPLQVLMNYEKSISTARQKQADEQTKIEEKLANNNEEQSKIEKQIADNNKEIQIINAEGQGFTMQSSTAQGTAVVPFRKRKQNGKFRTIPEIQKENQRLIKKINKLDPLISKRTNLDKAESVLKKKGLPLKESYTLEEAKQVLSPQDFNQLLTERADVVFRASDKKGEPSITAGKSKPNTSNQYIKEVAATKNIELNFNDPAVKYAAKQWTGIENIANTKVEGARRLFLARLHALPTFSKALPFPDFRTRTHTAEETAEFIAKARDQLSTFDLKSLQAMNKDQQFLDDLVYSGRAERVEGTKNYRLVNNADFEIARRSEGFNETPTEYRTRLEAEAKLDPEVIDEMVQEEEVKQAKFLPPKEIEQQQINYAEAIEEGKTNKFAKEARKILNKTGLKETGIVISNDILSPTGLVEVDGKFSFDPKETRQYNVEGEYDRNNDVIFLSLNAVNPDGNASDQEIQNALNKIIDHEMIHALRAKDVITEKEYNYLRKEVKRRKVPVSFDSTSKGETFYERSKRINTQFELEKYDVNEFKKEELYVEEAIAELYRARNIKPDVPPKAETIFQKVIQFFKSMGQAFRNSGYQKASDLFADIESGKVGSRTRGQVRTLRDIDRTESGLGGYNPYQTAPAFSVKNTAKRFDTGENDRFGNPMFSYEYRGYQIQKVEIEQNNYPKPDTYYEAWNVTDSEGYTGDTENTLKEAKQRVDQYLDDYESIDDVPLFSRSRNPNQERIDSLNQVLAGIQGQLRESTSPKTVTRLRARERKLKDEIEMLEGLPDDDAPLFSRTGRKHGVDRAYTIESEGEVTGKPSVVKVITENNADEVIENLQGLLDRHPLALDSEEAWLAFERDLLGDNETFIPPGNLINLVNNLNSWVEEHTTKLNKKQLQDVSLGFRGVEEMRKIYADGTATPETTAKLIAWGILSRGVSAVNQESAFIDAANDPRFNEFIARALEKEFTDVDVNEFFQWTKTVMPEGSFGKQATHNLNAFGKQFLQKASKKQSNGISKLEAIHNLFANQDLSSTEIRREYYKIIQGSGMNNKVLSFALLMSGRNDVIVLDRIQINNMWDSKSKYQKNIYDDVANQLNGIHGLARYEVMEKALLDKIDSLYEAIGRPQDSSIGRYHWESWVRNSNQEVQHPSIQGIYKEALEGIDSKPYADLGVPEGRYDRFHYGATYARDVNGNPYVNYPKSNGDMAKFSLEKYNEFIQFVSDKKVKRRKELGILPKDFKVTQIKEGFPWYESEGVNREKLDQFIEAYTKGTTSTTKVLQDNGENIQSDVTRRRESPETRRRREQLKEITDEVAPQPTELDVPLFSRKNRDSSQGNTSEAIARRRAVENVVETVKRTPRGDIPHYNANASDVALEAAYNFNNDPTAPTPEMPKFSVGTVPDYLKETADRVGISQPKKTQFESIMDVIQNPVESIRYMFKNVRSNIIDGLSAVDKILLDGQDKEWYLSRGFTEQEAEEKSRAFRLADNNILTRTIANLRLADKTRGLFQHMITQGNITDQVIDENSETGYSDSIAVVEDMELVDENNKLTGKFGGLMQFFAPLYQSNSGNDLVSIFGIYAKIKRPEQKNEKTGEIKKSPVIEKDREQVSQIEKDFPEVVAAYNNYQKWNNKIIEFAAKKGILNKEQADEWKAHSSYYPYYRDMAMTEEALKNSKITAPTISGGALPSNPLDIELKGSEKPITVDPIEAISRNSLSIITAALKNNGAVMLMKDLESMGLAESMGRSVKKFDKQGNRVSTFNIVHAYENGEKFFYNLEDAEIHNALSAVGGTSTSNIAKWVGIPSTLLRDTVTRDPGFIVVNILRDTLSSAVTSGAAYGNSEDGYLPVIDSFKNMFGDMGELEKFGIIGGYDFSNDEGSVKQFVERTMRRQGLTKNGAMKPQDAFYKIWDGLGALTTKSDGATRKAVYDSVYKHMKKQGATEGQAQSEAAYQALEVINFGRRGLSTNFKVVTAAIPFLNARIQGLDVLYRSFSGKYSAIDKLQGDETRQELKGRILRGAILRGATLSLITGLYYMMVSDTDEYKGARREVRDDYWIIPTGTDFPIRIPIPFEVGAIFKVLPERLIDMAMGDDALTKKAVGEAKTSLGRQLGTSLGLPFTQPAFGIQAVKPLFEVWNNRNSFTDSEIIPYYQTKLDPRAQSTERTNELARVLGEAFNISPTKIDYVMRGYAGTLGGYLLSMADTGTRMITGTPILPNNVELSRLPLIRRLTFDSKKAGGLQQQFYELRGEVDKVVQTVNKLNNDGRADEAVAYRSNMQGVLNVKGQVRSMERYLSAWRKRRRRLLQRDDISITVRSDMLRDMEIERDRRLAMIPELRKQANIPITSFGL